mmetsp:Transcript_11127/g.68494  ORF Transcript_11127/g.68494 Transcript_11127/m.68494 type:complete len:459 (+) Transcript_11127:149-1525(+)
MLPTSRVAPIKRTPSMELTRVRMRTVEDEEGVEWTDEIRKTTMHLDESMERTHPPGGGADLVSSVLNVANNIIGAGTLTLPFALKQASLVPGAMLITATGWFTAYSFLLLTRCCETSQCFDYREMGRLALGERFGILQQTIMMLYTMGACTSFVVLIGDFLPGVFANPHVSRHLTAGMRAVLADRANVLILCGFTILLPLSMVRNLNMLRHSSMLGLLSILYTVAVICEQFFSRLADGESMPEVQVWDFSWRDLVALPLVSVAYTFHYNAPRYYQELEGRGPIKAKALVAGSLSLCWFVYIISSTCGYLTFGAEASGNILLNYVPSTTVALAQLGLVLHVFTSYPLVFNSWRRSFHALAFPNRPLSQTRLYLYTSIGVSLTVFVGWLLPEIETVMGYNGSVFGAWIVYVFPALMNLKLRKQKIQPLEHHLTWIMLVFGVVLSFGGAITTFLGRSGKLG